MLLLCGWLVPGQALEQRVKLEGRWDGERIVAHKIKERDPDKDESKFRITGRVLEISPEDRWLQIGPVRLSWRAEQDPLIAEVVIGAELEVRVRKITRGQFSITSVTKTTLDAEDAIELIGSVTGARREDDWSEILVAEIPVWAPRSLYSQGRIRLRRLDDQRPDDQFTMKLGDIVVTVGGELEFELGVAGDRDLDSRDDDSRLEMEPGFQLESSFQITDSVSAYAEIKGAHARTYDIPLTLDEQETEYRRGEMWVFVDQPFSAPFSIQFGRQNFAEEREWWWDDDLDALRIYYVGYQYQFEVAIAENTVKETLNIDHADEEDQDILRVLGKAEWHLSSAFVIDAFFLHQDDHSEAYKVGTNLPVHREDEDDADLTWFGTRFSGGLDIMDDVEVRYWVDWALVRGSDTTYSFDDVDDDLIVVESVETGDRSGEAVDLGAVLTWEDTVWGYLRAPTLTLSYAFGSGDGDNSFRQTGLNDNNGRFNGVDRFRYYGELTDPELENLGVSTAAVGFRFSERSSVELVHHNYRQAEKNDEHSLRIRSDTTGRSRDLGNEYDVVVGVEEWRHWELEMIGSYFIPGSAFEEDDDAWQFAFKLNYNF